MSTVRALVVSVAVLALATAALVIPVERAAANVVCLGDGATPPTVNVPTPALEGDSGDPSPIRELVVACGPASDPIGAAWELQWSSVDPLPAGMQFSGQANNQLRGIPQQHGVYTITIQVIATNALDSTNPVTLTQDITVISRPRFTGWTTPTATVGAAYHGGLYGYGSGVSAVGALPPGLTLADDGAITGVPEYVLGSGDSRSYSFRGAVNSASATRLFTITVDSSTPTIATTSLAEGWTGMPYTQTLAAPYGADWAASGLPDGLSLSGDRISGTPTEAGAAAVAVTASRGASHSASSTLELLVRESASLADTALVRAVRGVPYDHVFTFAGDNVLFSGSSDAPGLVVENGRISGTPTAAGQYGVEVVVENGGARVTRSFELVVSDPGYTVSEVQAAPGQVVVFGAAGLPAGDEFDVTLGGREVLAGVRADADGAVSRTFSVPGIAPGTYPVEAAGAAVPSLLELTVLPVLDVVLPQTHFGVPYAGRIESRHGGVVAVAPGGTLPLGLELHPDGTVEGVAVYDGASSTPVSRSIPIVVNGVAAGAVEVELILDAPALEVAEPPTAVVGVPYVFTVPVDGEGVGMTVAGDLPTGVELVDGQILGTPLVAGEFAFTVTADNLAGSDSRDYVLVVSGPTVVLSSGSVAAGGQLEVRGENFPPGAEVTIWVHSEPVLLATTTSDADGRVRASVAIPPSLPPGSHRIEVRASTGSAWVELSVVPGLASSGMNPLVALVIAALLMVGGAMVWRRGRGGRRAKVG